MTPIEPTTTSYTQGDAFQAEKRTLFARSWLPVCHGSELAARGSFIAQTIGGWPVFAARGDDGAIRVFRNVCRHQGMQVVEKSPGTCTEFRCRYHGWTYDLAGRFVTAPDPVAPADACSPDHNLQQLQTNALHGFVFCTMAAGEPEADPEAAALRPFGNASSRIGLIQEIGCNWKTYLEQRLAQPGVSLVWPLLVVEQDATRTIAEQVVPRTFLRTRVVFHASGADQGAVSVHADAIKAASEALQRERAAGTMPQLRDGIASMWTRIGEALAGDVPAA